MPDSIRNHVARSALMRKGGAHVKSRSSYRRTQKRQLQDAVADYLEELEEIDEHKKTASADGSGRFLFRPPKSGSLERLQIPIRSVSF